MEFSFINFKQKAEYRHSQKITAILKREKSIDTSSRIGN